MVIENVNISKNVDDTFMIRVFIDNGDEKVEVILDRVMLEDFTVKQEEIIEVITKPQKVRTIATKESIEEFHVNLTGIALYGVDDGNGNVGRVIKYPKKND